MNYDLNHKDTGAQRNTMFTPLSQREMFLGKQVCEIAFELHKSIGPGLLESVYERLFCHHLIKRGISFQRQMKVELIYDGIVIDDGLRIDLLIENKIIIELKAQEVYHPVWEAQLLSYLKLTGLRLGYLINFHVPLMKNGLKRMIL
jgi:GxxExxY protein